LEGVKSVWGSSWYLAAKEGHTNMPTSGSHLTNKIIKSAMVQIKVNRMLSIRKE